MLWVVFSILAALLWGMVNIVDKFIFTKWVSNPWIPVLISGVVGVLASAIVYEIKGFSTLSYTHLFLAFLAGTFHLLINVFYFKAVKIEEISRVVPLFYVAPLFVAILAAFFLGEIFTLLTYIGIFFLVGGAILISSKTSVSFKMGKAFWFMILSSLAVSVNLVITKYLLSFADFWSVFSYIRIGAFLALIPVWYFNFQDLVSTVNEYGKKVVGVIALDESLTLTGILFLTIAMATGYVTLVNALTSIQPFFVLLSALLLSLFYPWILKEEIGKPAILLKFFAILSMFIGALLITS
ncbi:MAG: EamA family transporter [Candidatus Portnoybacteria bacterium]|nr:EamA family transporter [Candidatus Portnoybacteria bacterium]